VGGGVPRNAETERLNAELACPARLITQHVLKLPLRLLTGEEGANRAKVSVNEAPEVCRVWARADRRRMPASGSALTGSFYRFSDQRLQQVSLRVRVHRVPDFQEGLQFSTRIIAARSVDLDDVLPGLHGQITGPVACTQELRETG
jgi:hypothetical protein